MLIIGLTGGIGSGKSTAARYFSALGVPVVDADAIGRELVTPGRSALNEIVATFGPDVIDDHGRLRRDRLRRIIFAQPERRQALEHILHPKIRRVMRRRLAKMNAPYGIAVIPLLVETGQTDTVHRVLVIDAPPALQIARTRHRDGIQDQEIAAIIQSQAGREARLAAADDVIVNDGDLAQLKQAVTDLHRRYSELGRQPPVK